MKRISLTVAEKGVSITPQELMEAQEAEANMALQDKLIAETAEAMNALEVAVYSLRDDLSTRLEKYFTDGEREKLSSTCTAMEDWLYDEGMDVEKSVYQGKLKELKDAFAPGEEREREDGARRDAYDALEKAIEKYAAFAASDAEEYAHIGTEEKQKVAAECATAQGYLAETKGKLDALPKTETPPIKCAEIVAKADALGAMAAPIMNTPKPLPPKPEEPPPAAEGAAAEGEAAPAEGGEAAPAEGDATPAAEEGSKDNMDVD